MLNRNSIVLNTDRPLPIIDDTPISKEEGYRLAKEAAAWLLTHDEHGYPIEPQKEPVQLGETA